MTLLKRARPAVVRIGVLAAVALLATGCIGARDSKEITAEANRRGGGGEPFVIRAAEAAVARRLGIEPGSVPLSDLYIVPARVILEAGNPSVPGNWDNYSYSYGKLGESRPMTIRIADDEPQAFRLGDFKALDRLPALVADAVQRTGFSEPTVESVRVRHRSTLLADGSWDPVLLLEVGIDDPRRGSVTLQYDMQGQPVGRER